MPSLEQPLVRHFWPSLIDNNRGGHWSRATVSRVSRVVRLTPVQNTQLGMRCHGTRAVDSADDFPQPTHDLVTNKATTSDDCTARQILIITGTPRHLGSSLACLWTQ